MIHRCPWCGRLLPVRESLGREAVCPGCHGRIRMPGTLAGQIEKVAQQADAPGSEPDEQGHSGDIEIDGPPPEKKFGPAAAAGGGPAPSSPGGSVPGSGGPGDGNWRPFLTQSQRPGKTYARAGGGIFILILATYVFSRVGGMARRAKLEREGRQAQAGQSGPVGPTGNPVRTNGVSGWNALVESLADATEAVDAACSALEAAAEADPVPRELPALGKAVETSTRHIESLDQLNLPGEKGSLLREAGRGFLSATVEALKNHLVPAFAELGKDGLSPEARREIAASAVAEVVLQLQAHAGPLEKAGRDYKVSLGIETERSPR